MSLILIVQCLAVLTEDHANACFRRCCCRRTSARGRARCMDKRCCWRATTSCICQQGVFDLCEGMKLYGNWLVAGDIRGYDNVAFSKEPAVSWEIIILQPPKQSCGKKCGFAAKVNAYMSKWVLCPNVCSSVLSLPAQS